MTVSTFTTPKQAFVAMVDAGAVFAICRRGDACHYSYTYRVADGGDPQRCRSILADVKARPTAFLAALKAHVQDAVAATERGAA